MNHYGSDTCEICGIERDKSDRWFLLLEDRWQDTLKIIRWEPHLAPELGIQRLCCSAHLQQLVYHWMLAGSLTRVVADRTNKAVANAQPQLLLAMLDALGAALESSEYYEIETEAMICDA